MTAQPLPSAAERLAAIDVGSNSIRLVVAEYEQGAGLNIIDEVKEQPRLAAGVESSGELDPLAMEHAFEALQRMLDVCQRRGVERIRAVATSAVREASNGPEFLARIKSDLGLDLEIIDGRTEALLSYRSVAHHFRLAGNRTLVADIGGGSLELVGAVDGLIEVTDSLPFGAVRLTEKFLDEPKPYRGLKRLRKKVRKKLRQVLPGNDWTAATVIGSGGSFTNLGRMAAARRGVSPDEPTHGTSVPAAEVEHLLERLVNMRPEERAQVPGLNPNRADIILAGLGVTAELLHHVEAREVTVSAFGLREGLLLEMAGADPVPASDEPMRLVREFAERCRTDWRHVEQVRYLSLVLFDRLAEILGADSSESLLLEAASLVHDVGQLVNYKDHHKHSYQLIMHADRLNLSPPDRTKVALISRYHRKKGPSRKHTEFDALPLEDQEVVRRMSALLRVADGLDRGGSATVNRVEVDLEPKRVTITVYPKNPGTDLSLECWSAGRKADVLAKLLDREVAVVQA